MGVDNIKGWGCMSLRTPTYRGGHTTVPHGHFEPGLEEGTGKARRDAVALGAHPLLGDDRDCRDEEERKETHAAAAAAAAAAYCVSTWALCSCGLWVCGC